jgi:hypothetical protein
MKKILSFLVLAVAVGAGVSSCTYYENDPVPVVLPDTVYFDTNVLPIFDARCDNTGCHATGGIAPDLTTANAYNSLITFGYVDTDLPEQSQIYIKMSTGSMAKFTSPGDADIVLKWIEQGALDSKEP